MLILGLLQLRRERKNKAIAAGTDQESPGHWMAARKTPGFWMVLVGSFMFLLASGGFAGNAAPIYEQMGCTTMEASFAISVRSVVQLGWALLFGVLALTAISLVVQLLASMVRLAIGKRPKKPNTWYFVMFFISGLVCAFVTCALYVTEGGLAPFFQLFAVEGVNMSIWAICGYYLVFTILSLVAKTKQSKTN